MLLTMHSIRDRHGDRIRIGAGRRRRLSGNAAVDGVVLRCAVASACDGIGRYGVAPERRAAAVAVERIVYRVRAAGQLAEGDGGAGARARVETDVVRRRVRTRDLNGRGLVDVG